MEHMQRALELANLSDGSVAPRPPVGCVIVRDAAYYAVPFEHYAQAVRESLDDAAIEKAALRLLSLPMFPNLTPEAQRTVVEQLRQVGSEVSA